MMAHLETPPLSTELRIAAGVAGLALLSIGSPFSAGAVLAAALGIWIAAIVGNARHRPLVRWTAWVVACSTAAAYLVLGAAVLVRRLPDGTIARAQATADSAAAAQPQPAWVERLGGKAARNAAPITANGPVAAWAMVVGVVFAFSFMSAISGTCAWGVAMLLTFGFTGRWIPKERGPPEASAP